MSCVAGPDLKEHPDPINPNWFSRGCALGAMGGTVIALGFLVALNLTDECGWSFLPVAAIIGLPVGAAAGATDAVLVLLVLGLLPRRALAKRWPAALVAASMAAAAPLLFTFHAGYPTTDGGIWIGLGLSAAAFAAGAALTPVALRPGTRL